MSLLANIALMYAILVGVNLPAPLLGLNFGDESSRQRLWFERPGFVIPLAWFVLFTLLGIARHELISRDPEGRSPWLIIALALLCATYAYYTLGLAKLTGVSALWYGLTGNLVVILFAMLAVILLSPVSGKAALLVAPVVLWTVYATAIVLGEMKAQDLI